MYWVWPRSVFLPKFSSPREKKDRFQTKHRKVLLNNTIMTDFFSRIFSIPSDDSSTYSSSAGIGSNAAEFWSGRTATTRKKNKRRKNIVSLASSIGEESESLMARSKLISSSGSDDDDDSEGRDADRRALRPDGSGVSRSRGRHRRSSSSDHQPIITPPPPSKRSQSEVGVGTKHNRAQSNQRSLSKLRKAASSTRVQDDLNLDCYDPQSARSSMQNKQPSSSSSHRLRQQQQQQHQQSTRQRLSEGGGSQANWLSRTFGGGGAPTTKKHSPGSSSGGGNGGGTTIHSSFNGGIKHMISSPRRERHTKLNLPSPGRSGDKGGLRQQPINVGDSIMIAQKYLEECEEMSALTVPKELMSVMSGLSGPAERGAMWRDDVQEVGRRNVLESSIVKAYHSNGHTRQSDDDDDEDEGEIILTTTNTGPAYPNIGEFASRFLETKEEEKEEEDEDDNDNDNYIIHQINSRDSNVHDKVGCGTSQAGSSKHQWLCDPSTEEYPMKVNGRMPPPPPLMPMPRRALPLDNIHNLSSQKRVSASFDDKPATFNDEVSFDEEKSRMDPPGTLGGAVIPNVSYPSTQIHAPDPPEDKCHPSDKVSNLSAKKRTPQSVTCQSIAGQSNFRSPNSKAVTFSLPPPTTMLQPSQVTPPSPPFMSPNIDYYTLDQQSNTTKPLRSWLSSALLPPIAELWSSVESMPPINSTLMWDTKKENELLGEGYSLLVSEEWIDFCDDLVEVVVVVEEQDVVKTIPVDADVTALVSSNRDVHSGFSHDEDTPDDEYIEDILNCSEEDDFEGIIPAVSSSNSSNISNNNANIRHRSKWEVAYTPFKLGSISTELIQVEDDKWQSLIRERANAAMTIQRCVRGMLERERYYLCLGSAIILQPFIRKFLSRKRYREYTRLKQSYYPKRWERVNMNFPHSIQ